MSSLIKASSLLLPAVAAIGLSVALTAVPYALAEEPPHLAARVPGGCLATAPIDAGELNAFRNARKPGKLSFTDVAERTLALPISFRSLAQALDDLDRHS